jgi:uncharacterized protein (TIGR02284 family)
MSIDHTVTADLVEVLIDGKDGLEHAGKRLRDSERPDLADRFQTYANDRAAMAAELEAMAAAYGDRIDEDGSVAAAAHRGWISLKDAITTANPAAVLNAALTGEDHAISEYEDALDQDISESLRAVVQRQLDGLRNVRADVDLLAQAADAS